MLFILLLLAISYSQDDDIIEREKLAFIERSLMEIYAKGTFPEIFNTKVAELDRCGCTYGTQGIYWGTKVGMMCKLREDGFEESCGERCTTPKGEEILLLCPVGWKRDCFRGCVPPGFESVGERFQFLLQNIEGLLNYGHDYLLIDPEYLESCGCRSGQARLINYGTNLGFDCVVEGEPGRECGGFQECQNEREERVMIFCPAGHEPSCEGCKSTLADIDPTDYQSDDIRYEWAINVMTGYIRESQAVLDIQPTHEDTLNCGCRGPLVKVDYGNRIGFYCQIEDPRDMSAKCSNKLICVDHMEKELIHFCPSGFVPDCERGCGYWWAQQKEEL